MERDGDTEGLVTNKRRSLCTLGAAVNYTISLLFLAILFCGAVIIGTLGTLQSDLHDSDYSESAQNTSSPLCILFFACDPVNDSVPCILRPDENRVCGGTMALFGLMGALALIFVVSLFVKAILRHE